MVDAAGAIAALEAALERTPSTSEPYEHALLAHRLGVAYAESPGRPGERLRQALAHLDRAASLLEPTFHPVEHARVLTAAGAVRRSMGAPDAALELFRRALVLAAHRVEPDEAAAMANNVGLALLETGQAAGAVAHFDDARARFSPHSAEGRRGRSAALHNRGLALAAPGPQQDLAAAVDAFDEALAAASLDDAPLHHGLIHHSRGVAAMALAGGAPPGCGGHWRTAAIESFRRALELFTWPAHRSQHAVASFNLGRAWAAGDAVDDLRLALVCFEDAVTAFDPRDQGEAWRAAYAALEATDARLAGSHPGWTRADHLVALLGDAVADAPALVEGRLARWLPLPGLARSTALDAFSQAAFRRGGDGGTAAVVGLLVAAMERPTEAQEAVLDSLLSVRRAADEGARPGIDAVIDRMIGEAVVGPQRVFVRDYLTAGGFERP